MSTTRRPHKGAVNARNSSKSPLKTQDFSHGLIYKTNYLSAEEKDQLLSYLRALHPIWESRYSKSNPPPDGKERWLLRPVYWLGNWQFACLDYYHPPKGIEFRCVEAEPFPAVLKQIVKDIEAMVHREFDKRDIPKDWQLNTCLVNYYGSRLVKSAGGHNCMAKSDRDDTLGENEGTNATESRWEDVARVGEHRDYEPGPVASVSFGERALFQFVQSKSKQHSSQVVKQMWLEDNSLQIFGGDRWKKKLFHRVQRVEKKLNVNFSPDMPDFKTRRLNLTFRFVPHEHILPFRRFPEHLCEDILPYLKLLAPHSEHFRNQISQSSN